MKLNVFFSDKLAGWEIGFSRSVTGMGLERT